MASRFITYINNLDDITNNSMDLEVQQRVRLYLFWLCWGKIFADKFGCKFSSNYLFDMRDLPAM